MTLPGADGIVLRPARDGDGDDLIRIMASAYAEYEGCVLDVDGEEPELRAIATAFAARSGRFWVAERQGRPVGMAGGHPVRDGTAWELKKLYVDKSARGAGLGTRLVGLVEDAAGRAGATRLELWTDTRFADAHRLYERLGFRRRPGTRRLDDLSRSVEYHYAKDLAA